MKRGKGFLAFWETILILGSIPVFRSVWMALDGFDFMNGRTGMGLSFGIGLMLCVAALVALNTRAKDQQTNDRENRTKR